LFYAVNLSIMEMINLLENIIRLEEKIL
jgi:hypothetical protein